MFLNQLSERQKNNFYILAKEATIADNAIQTQEETLLNDYCREMHINPETVPNNTLDSVIEDIVNNATKVEKNIMYLEVLGLLKIDGVFSDEEREYLKKINVALDVNEEIRIRMDALLDVYQLMYSEMNNLIRM